MEHIFEDFSEAAYLHVVGILLFSFFAAVLQAVTSFYNFTFSRNDVLY